MTRPAARLQVALTGTRLASSSDADVLARLQTKFKLTPAQSAAMLKGRCIVKRDVDPRSARKLVAVLSELGLEAVVEEMKASPSSPPRSIPAATSSSAPAATPRPASAITSRTAAAAAALVSQPPPRASAAAAEVPLSAAPSASTPSAGPSGNDALEALRALGAQKLPTPRAHFGYLAGLLVVTLLCIALPATYIALTGGVAYGWFWYLTHIHHHLPRNGQLIALMYAVPGVAGALLVLFLLRPLFAPRPPKPEVLRLDPEKEPDFVAGVHALCRAIGVSPPIEIQLSWDANASVHFRTRWLSFFSGHKVLTIGLSLVGGLSARQFVGVLAHEFGHFAQRFGMICSFTVNTVNAWLEHRAFGEDEWDRKMREWSDRLAEQENWFSGIVNLSLTGSWIAIGITRRLMAGLFMISLRLSRYMSRQMEYDADRYEALLSGSETFRRTARSLRALNHAFAEVNRSNIEAWQQQRLLADLPDAVAAHAGGFDAARLQRIDEEMSEETVTRFWDSHPPDVKRIENAEKLHFPGIFTAEIPATLLFRDFEGWSKRATRLFYAKEGVEFKDEQLRSRADILAPVQQRNQHREQISRFFNGQFQEAPLFHLRPPQATPAELLSWQDCIDRIRAKSPEIARDWLNACQAEERRPQMRAAVQLNITSRMVGLPGAERPAADVAAELGNIAARRLECHKPLDDAFALYARRVQHAIDAMAPAEREQATQLRDTLLGIGELERDAAAIDELMGGMRVFQTIGAANDNAMPPGFDELEASFGDKVWQLITRADRIPQSIGEGTSVGAHLRTFCRDLPASGAKLEGRALAHACWSVPAALHRFYLTALGQLVTLCEATEKSRGIRPIKLVA